MKFMIGMLNVFIYNVICVIILVLLNSNIIRFIKNIYDCLIWMVF